MKERAREKKRARERQWRLENGQERAIQRRMWKQRKALKARYQRLGLTEEYQSLSVSHFS